jgi:uncharacterized protein YidB (DUF937 family)
MGIFDSILGSVASNIEGAEAAKHPLVGVLAGFVAQNGGVDGVVNKFSQQGLEAAATSWVGNEANQAITPDHIQQVFGSGQINEIASKLGIDPATASSFLAQHLPEIINQLTPNGQTGGAVDHSQAIASMLPSLLQTLGKL